MRICFLAVLILWPLLSFGQSSTPTYRQSTELDFHSIFDIPDGNEGIVTEPISPLHQLWNEQSNSGVNMVQEKGTAGFFDINGKTAGAEVYAFHSSAARGTVIQVKNLNNDRIIFVKILGTLPDTKQFAGCIIGLSNGAKAALGVRDNKAFCELSYSGY